MSEIKDKVIWITGASSGIGSEFAMQVAKMGAKLVLSSRNKDSLEKVKSQLVNSENHLVLPLDLENSSNFDQLVEQVIEKYGRIDILLNNGGLSQRADAFDTSLEVDRRIMEINYFGNITLSKALLPQFRKQKSGHIVVISSIAGKFGFYLRSAYCASKHALQGFYESLRLEEEDYGLKVTLVYPGKINTDITKHALGKDGKIHGKMEHDQSKGMSVPECVKQLVASIEKDKLEVLIGNREVTVTRLKRFFPGLFWRIIRKQPRV